MEEDNKNISIVIPVYNEEKKLKQVIEEIKNITENFDFESELITVNDCSTDNSLKILESLDGVKLINHTRNKGYGASLKTGIKKASYEWILIIDADGTYPVNMIPEFLKYRDDYDLITGRRDTPNSAIPLERKHAKKFLNHYATYLAGKQIPDLNCGLRVFKKNIVFKYWELFPERFSFTSTLTMICATHGYETKFIPIDYYKREGKSSIKPTDFFNFLKLVTKLSLFFKPFKVFAPISLILFLAAGLIAGHYLFGFGDIIYDTTITLLCATGLQIFFFGLLAEIIIHIRK